MAACGDGDGADEHVIVNMDGDGCYSCRHGDCNGDGDSDGNGNRGTAMQHRKNGSDVWRCRGTTMKHMDSTKDVADGSCYMQLASGGGGDHRQARVDSFDHDSFRIHFPRCMTEYALPGTGKRHQRTLIKTTVVGT